MGLLTSTAKTRVRPPTLLGPRSVQTRGWTREAQLAPMDVARDDAGHGVAQHHELHLGLGVRVVLGAQRHRDHARAQPRVTIGRPPPGRRSRRGRDQGDQGDEDEEGQAAQDGLSHGDSRVTGGLWVTTRS
ncbi:MAG: hypothetical protein E6K81_15865 [Candidatus Eisenbacteria bacterium]|uniref:Uncharacterized protein n=1 Tax=Eiseniibacteriota bacterium TaxID=2212470 RepID=A0A538TZC6_UNCEI|nr:MAG: hypothetical protein E6K81_15865 [Candidatus Eisenbacteria bacterium]